MRYPDLFSSPAADVSLMVSRSGWFFLRACLVLICRLCMRSLFASVTVLRSSDVSGTVCRRKHILPPFSRLLYSPAHPPADQNHHPAQYILRSHIPSALPVSQFLKSSPLLSVIPSASGSCAAASFCCVSKSTDGNTFRYGRISPMIFENTRWHKYCAADPPRAGIYRYDVHQHLRIVSRRKATEGKPIILRGTRNFLCRTSLSSNLVAFYSRCLYRFPQKLCGTAHRLDKVAGRLGYCFPDQFRVFTSFTTEPCSF